MMKHLLFSLLSLMVVCNTIAQTLPDDHQILTPSNALKYIHQLNENPYFWRVDDDSLRSDLVRLLNHTYEPYDSVSKRLAIIDLQDVEIIDTNLLVRDTLKIRWLNDSTFFVDSMGWNTDLMIKREMQIIRPLDFSSVVFMDSSTVVPDTSEVWVIDTAALKSLEIPMYLYVSESIIPSLDQPDLRRSAVVSEDRKSVVYTDTISFLMARSDSPFYKVNGKSQLDSLENAVKSLVEYNAWRDSTRLIFKDMYGKYTPLWITSGKTDIHRFWVKNINNDSITLWIGNPASNEISFLLEDDVDITRLSVENVSPLPVKLKVPERKLANMQAIEPDPIFWDYNLASAFVFNQTYLSNWSKGGSNSLSTMLDINGDASYNNTIVKTRWINSVRLKYGNVIAEKKGLRKNNDIFEISSQINKNQRNNLDLSASFYMLNQIARGYNYPNDSVVVSKFLNPGSLTVGLGIEYKLLKHTIINLAPLSYKNTFVLDTANIDQTNHGIDVNKRAKQELGTQILLTNKLTPLEDLTITNKIRLFSNYLNNPQNIDVDWELLLDKKISWFFTVRLNLNLIYDDDVKFLVYDENDQVVLGPDGDQKKVSKTQFKEFIGLSLLFKL